MVMKRLYWLGLVAIAAVAVGVKVIAVDPAVQLKPKMMTAPAPLPMDKPIMDRPMPAAPKPAAVAPKAGMEDDLGALQNKFMASLNQAQMAEVSMAFQRALESALTAKQLDAGVTKVMEGAMLSFEAIFKQVQVAAETKTVLVKALNELSTGLQKIAKNINAATATPGEAYVIQVVNAAVRGAVAGLNSQPMVKAPVAVKPAMNVTPVEAVKPAAPKVA